MTTVNASVQTFGGQSTVGAVQMPVNQSGNQPIPNTDVVALANMGTNQFSAYPLVPGTDTNHDTAAGTGALAKSDGLQAGELVKSGTVTGVSVAATGVVTSAVTLTAAFPTALDNVMLTLRNPSAQTGVFGGLWTTLEGTAGFTINLDVTTAITSGTANIGWIAFGH